MGVLDSVPGSVLGAATPGGAQGGAAGGVVPGDIARVLAQMLGNDGAHGGLGGLVKKFNQAGMGNIISSWIGSGQNLPVSGNQLQEVLGSQLVGQLSGPIVVMLPKILPQVIDQLTPNGRMPQGGLGNSSDLLGAVASSLMRK